MSGYQVNGNDLDNIFATYAANTGFSVGFKDVTLDSNNHNTNPGQRVGYSLKVSSSTYDLSQRYVEITKLGASLKAVTADACNYKYGGGTDIGPLYAKKGTVEWSAAITAITSTALTNSNNVTFSFNFAGYPSKIDAYLTWPNNGTSTTNYGGSLPAIGQTAGGSGSLTVNSLPADTLISYQLRSYISGVNGPNMSYPSTASSFYTHPILSAPTPTSNSNGIVTSGNSVDYSYTLNGSPDVYQYAAVFTDSGLGTRYDSNTTYIPGNTITFKSMTPNDDGSSKSYTYYLAPYDQNTSNYNSGSDFVKALKFTIGVGSINYDTNTYSGGYQNTATSITVYLANIINVYSVTATANDVTGDTGGVPKGGTLAQNGSIAFACRPMTRYRISISGYYGDGSKYTFALTPFEVTTPSDVSITNIGATSTSTTITVSGTATNATSVSDSGGNSYSLTSNGAFTRDYAVGANTPQDYTVTASGTGGSDTKTVSRYTLPSLTAVTSTTGDQQVTITLTGVWDSSNNAQIFDGATQKSATNGSSIFTSGTAYTFTGLTNGTPYSWSVKLYNMNTSAYDVVYTSSDFAGLSFTPTPPGAQYSITGTEGTDYIKLSGDDLLLYSGYERVGGGYTKNFHQYTYGVFIKTSDASITVTSTVNVHVIVFGGGGGGAPYFGGGGGGGAVCHKVYYLYSTYPAKFTFNIGKGGAGDVGAIYPDVFSTAGGDTICYLNNSTFVNAVGGGPAYGGYPRGNENPSVPIGGCGGGGPALFGSGNHQEGGKTPAFADVPDAFMPSSNGILLGGLGGGGVYNAAGGGGGWGGGAADGNAQTQAGSNGGPPLQITKTQNYLVCAGGGGSGINSAGKGGSGDGNGDGAITGKGSPGILGGGGGGGGISGVLLGTPGGAGGAGGAFVFWSDPPLPGSISIVGGIYTEYDDFSQYQIITDHIAVKFDIMRDNQVICTINTSGYGLDLYGNYIYGAYDAGTGTSAVYMYDKVIAYDAYGNVSQPHGFD